MEMKFYASRGRHIRWSMNDILKCVSKIKHAYEISDDDLSYKQMKKDLMFIIMEVHEIGSIAEDLIKEAMRRP